MATCTVIYLLMPMHVYLFCFAGVSRRTHPNEDPSHSHQLDSSACYLNCVLRAKCNWGVSTQSVPLRSWTCHHLVNASVRVWEAQHDTAELNDQSHSSALLVLYEASGGRFTILPRHTLLVGLRYTSSNNPSSQSNFFSTAFEHYEQPLRTTGPRTNDHIILLKVHCVGWWSEQVLHLCCSLQLCYLLSILTFEFSRILPSIY